MADEIRITGRNELATLGRRLKAAGGTQLRKELLRGIRDAAKPAVPAVEQGARDHLPRSGGLAERVAGQKFAVRTSLASGSVKIVGQGMKELADMDAGRLRHPVFGNRKKWKAQRVTPGFFSGPIATREPEIRAGVERAMSDVAHKIERQL